MTDRICLVACASLKLSRAAAARDLYGYDVTYVTSDGLTLSCHYVGNERTAIRKTMLRAKAHAVTSTRGMTEEQYVRAFGRGRS